MNSVKYKKKERLENAKIYYHSFKKAYANSDFMQDADKMSDEIENELKNYSNKS